MLDTVGGCSRPSLRTRSTERPRSPSGGPGRDRLLLAGRYRLVGRVGRGGAAEVWRGHDERLDREVAVKQIVRRHPAGSGRSDGTEALTEARLAARVRHPNVAAVHDLVEQDRSCWLVQDYVPGRTLAAALRACGPLSPIEVAGLGSQVLAALEAVHAAGIVHCDVKPANLLLGDDGLVVLVDFGIARTPAEEATGRLGGAGPDGGEDSVVGTPAFLAPELARGERPQPAADLWSLGATLYCAVEGRPPFAAGDPASTLAAVLHDPPRPSHRAGPLRPLLERLLVKDPAGRPAHAEIGGLLAAVRGSAGRTPDRPADAGAADPDPDATELVPGWHRTR